MALKPSGNSVFLWALQPILVSVWLLLSMLAAHADSSPPAISDQPATRQDGHKGVKYLYAPADVGPNIKHAPGCSSETIVVEIGGIMFKVPRTNLEYVTESEKDQWGVVHYAEKECGITYVPHVFRIRTGGSGETFGIANYTKDVYGVSVGNYPSWKGRLKTWGADDLVTLPSGVKKLSHSDKEMYLFPLEQAPTGNGDPVVFDCTGKAASPMPADNCGVGYVHPDGLAFSYFFFRRSVPEEQYFAHDRHWRQVYEDMKLHDPSVGGAHKGETK